MSYCRFENTLGDLRDCYNAMCDGGKLSEDEECAKESLIALCRTILEDYGDEE
jgi:hypothetical protein